MLLWYFIAIIQFIFWGLIFQRLAWYRAPKITIPTTFPPISIIICARNELVNLQKHLEIILQQDYPIFELILVNDGSEDKSLLFLEDLQKKYPILKIVSIEKKLGLGKKNALTKGIEAAQYDWVLLTDADCCPASPFWVQTMLGTAIRANASIVLGYGPYQKANTWLNRWVQFETIYVAIQYFSFALWKQPYMGVGRNLLYKKELFTKNQGFTSHQDLISGDDDLFINEVANGKNTAICLNTNSFMFSTAPSTWKGLYRQKTRHYSSSNRYKFQHKLLLGLLSFSHFCFYLGFVFFIITNTWTWGILLVFILKFLLTQVVFLKYLTKTNHIDFFPYIAILEPLLPLYYFVFAPTLLNHRPKNWS